MKDYLHIGIMVFSFIMIGVLLELADEHIITGMQWFWSTVISEAAFFYGCLKHNECCECEDEEDGSEE